MKVICARRHTKLFIDPDRNDIVTRLCDHMVEIRKWRSDPDSRVAFTAGFYGIVIVKIYQFYHSCGVVVGGAYLNCYFPFDMTATAERSIVERGEDIRWFLEEYLQGKYGKIADEIKVCILSFQRIPRGVCLYFVLVGRPQTLNENNDLCATVIKAYHIAAIQSRGAVLLNVATDGVSCEVGCNFGIIVQYLNDEINYLALTDTNQKVKNARYQIIGTSSDGVLGENVFEPWLLRLANIVQQLWRIEDYASDAIFLHLASAKSVWKLV